MTSDVLFMPSKISADDYLWRASNAGRALSNALRRFEDRVLGLMGEDGFQETRRSHVNLTRHLDLDGTRITELARRAAMTNAAMTELIDQCESLGLVERIQDPTDGRARIVVFTLAGLGWLQAFGDAVQKAQKEMEGELGSAFVQTLVTQLARYADGDR
jgi:DNA-binding MarR family transcriptional regulator